MLFFQVTQNQSPKFAGGGLQKAFQSSGIDARSARRTDNNYQDDFVVAWIGIKPYSKSLTRLSISHDFVALSLCLPSTREMSLIYCVSALLLWSTTAFARVGDTKDQLAARYAKPFKCEQEDGVE